MSGILTFWTAACMFWHLSFLIRSLAPNKRVADHAEACFFFKVIKYTGHNCLFRVELLMQCISSFQVCGIFGLLLLHNIRFKLSIL
jgi:hypothetical protein